MKAFIIALLITAGARSYGQQLFFAYIQTENKQPFYVKVNDRMLSSSASGYIVIPKLTRGNYNITVGFPKDVFPQQQFAMVVSNGDAGYLLKNFPDKGWGLYNLQTMELAMAGRVAPVKTASDDDAFAGALGAATGTEIQMPNSKSQTANTNGQQPTGNGHPVMGVQRVFSEINGAEFSGVYNDGGDTVRVVVSEEKQATGNVQQATGNVQQETGNVQQATGNLQPKTGIEPPAETVPVEGRGKEQSAPAEKEAKSTTQQKINAIGDKIEAKVDQVVALIKDDLKGKGQSAPADKEGKSSYDAQSKPVVGFNSDCKALASDDDFLKLRKKMVGETDNEAMMADAKKAFKQKCFSTEQVKNLGVLFLTDAGKYEFFDAAYPRVNDSANYGSLVTLFSDPYYINRFNAMLRK